MNREDESGLYIIIVNVSLSEKENENEVAVYINSSKIMRGEMK